MYCKHKGAAGLEKMVMVERGICQNTKQLQHLYWYSTVLQKYSYFVTSATSTLKRMPYFRNGAFPEETLHALCFARFPEVLGMDKKVELVDKDSS